MNAPTTISVPTADRDAQALMAQCRDRRWHLLQQFARLEIALKFRLESPPKTFGAKMRSWIKLTPANKRFERLITARNLVAHGLVSCIRVDDMTYALWEVAEGTSELDCAKFDKPALKAWADDLDSLLEQAMVAGPHPKY